MTLAEDIMGKIKILYPNHFQGFKIRISQTKVKDLVNEVEQEEEILGTHNEHTEMLWKIKLSCPKEYFFLK